MLFKRTIFEIVITINDWPLLQYKELHGLVLYGYVLVILFKNNIFNQADADHRTSDMLPSLGWERRECRPEMVFISHKGSTSK